MRNRDIMMYINSALKNEQPLTRSSPPSIFINLALHKGHLWASVVLAKAKALHVEVDLVVPVRKRTLSGRLDFQVRITVIRFGIGFLQLQVYFLYIIYI